MDWLLVLGLEEGLVECATLCTKTWVILINLLLNLNLNFTIIFIFFLDPEFAVEPVSESGPTGGPESVDIVDVDSDNDDDYLVEDDPSPSKL
jgi:hypothetical protein